MENNVRTNLSVKQRAGVARTVRELNDHLKNNIVGREDISKAKSKERKRTKFIKVGGVEIF